MSVRPAGRRRSTPLASGLASAASSVRLSLAVVLAFVAVPAAIAQSAGRADDAPRGPAKSLVAVLEVPGGEAPEIDFGVVGRKELLSGTITLRNVSDAPITVVKMATTCKCTTLEDLSGETIAPGADRSVVVEMESKARTGENRNEVSFIMSDGNLYKVQLVAEVIRAINPEPTYITVSTPAFGLVRVSSSDGRPFRVLSVSYGDVVYADGFRPGTDAPRTSYMLSWNFEAFDQSTCENEKGERMPLWWAIETDHPDAPVIELRVRHDPCTFWDLPSRGGREWYLAEQIFVLDGLEPGSSRIVETQVKWLPRTVPNDEIKDVVSLVPDRFRAELVETVREGDETTLRIRITVPEGVRGLVFGMMRARGHAPGASAAMTVVARSAPAGG